MLRGGPSSAAVFQAWRCDWFISWPQSFVYCCSKRAMSWGARCELPARMVTLSKLFSQHVYDEGAVVVDPCCCIGLQDEVDRDGIRHPAVLLWYTAGVCIPCRMDLP